MRQQPVIAHADAHVDGEHIEHRHHRQPLPAEKEKRRQRARMKQNDDHQGQPVDAFTHGCGAAHANKFARGLGMSCVCGRRSEDG